MTKPKLDTKPINEIQIKMEGAFNPDAEPFFPKKTTLEEDFDEIEENNLPENEDEFLS